MDFKIIQTKISQETLKMLLLMAIQVTNKIHKKIKSIINLNLVNLLAELDLDKKIGMNRFLKNLNQITMI